ncbi:MAG: LptF/LptG family permease [Bacteroidia bacterium]|nr:LptF/LptG family permease [Bacteroidia bacterium]MDW8089223.1 LptF/LptG family permease [Bacteroidia bacterium]
MKRLDTYLLQLFVGPFLASFATTLVILVLQFLSRYQEDILGKGFPTSALMELFLYASVSLTLLALPMGLLMAGLMTMGGLGERLELTALQSAGIPFFRAFLPLLIWGLGSLTLAGWLGWILVPKANLRLYTLLSDMERARPALALKPGLFNRWIEGYALRIGRLRNERLMEEVLIYEYAPDGSIARTLLADSGEVSVEKEWLFLRLRLYNGCQYETPTQTSPTWVQSCFDTLELRLDISGLGLRRSDGSILASHQYMLDGFKLREAVDSLAHLVQSVIAEGTQDIGLKLFPKTAPAGTAPSFPLPSRELRENLIRHDKSLLELYRDRHKNLAETLRRYELEWYYKFAYPLATVVFLILGASLGGVIRKGGLGMPLVVSTAFFILFYVLNAQGKKLAREGVLSPSVGAFLPLIVIGPIALYLLLLVTTEARWLYRDFWQKRLQKWIGIS